MKKVSLFALALSTSLAMFAQPDQPTLKTPMATQTRFGVRAGANLANYNTEGFGTAPDVNTKTSMHAGLFVNIPLGTMFAFQPGVEYSGQGSKINYKGTTTGFPLAGTYEEDLHYINVPMMVQWKSKGGFFLETGPQPGFLIKATRDNTGTGGTAGQDVDIKASRDNFDISWGAGLGYLSRIGLGLNARYNYGLSNTIEDGGGNNSSNTGPELKNRVIQIGLVYHFGAGK